MFLGFQIKQLKDGIFMHQEKYIHDLLKRFGMENCKEIKTPMASNGQIEPDLQGKPIDQKFYRSMIGSLLYLIASRPDIMFSVCMCARYQANPKESHEKAVKRILRYLRYTPCFGLWYPKGVAPLRFRPAQVRLSLMESSRTSNELRWKHVRHTRGKLINYIFQDRIQVNHTQMGEIIQSSTEHFFFAEAKYYRLQFTNRVHKRSEK